ncbi:MAG: hypothetical protein EB084_17100 [Proteobacteria bacterium]|nr:hypothetical protein [Pseudomonadota bacterium]
MVRSIRLAALTCIIVSSLLRHAAAQQPVPLEDLLLWQDAMVLSRYQSTYLCDTRYDGALRRISQRLNPHLAEVFQSAQPVQYYVFIGQMGFNAQTWHHLIIFDALLLDTLRKLADGVAVYGTTECDYVRRLAVYVAQVDQAKKTGRLTLRVTGADNPYRLPTLWGMTPAQRDRADVLFDEMLASWMAHEGSHAFLHHSRERAEAQQLLQMYSQQTDFTSDSMQRYISTYLGTNTSRQKERDADEHGVRLIVKSGYSIEGLLRSLEFAQMIEVLTGEAQVVNRTHPTPAERISLARQIAEDESTAR